MFGLQQCDIGITSSIMSTFISSELPESLLFYNICSNS
jgi:hypothetical protein